MNKATVFLVFGLIFILGCSEQNTQQQNIKTEEKIVMEIVEEGEEDSEKPAEEVKVEEKKPIEEVAEDSLITLSELAKHNTKEDCWVVYEGEVYDITNPPKHPSMEKTFFRHCGKTSGFEEGAKGQHSGSGEQRVLNYATYVGELAK